MVVLDRDVNIIGYKVSSKTKKKRLAEAHFNVPSQV